jgi:hypothetical protein
MVPLGYYRWAGHPFMIIRGFLADQLLMSTGFLVSYTVASLATIIFACIPVQASWDMSLVKTAKCFLPKTYVTLGMWNAGRLQPHGSAIPRPATETDTFSR